MRTRPAPSTLTVGPVALPDSPVLPAAIAGVAGILFVVLRLLVVARGDPSRFVVAGTTFTDPATAPHGLHIFPNNGYDGQFFYRLGLAPVRMAHTAFGIRLDTTYRLQRIGYPALAWLFTGGQHRMLPDVLIILNVVGLAVLAWLGAVLAQDCGRHALWGLVFAAYFGAVLSLSRDLAEIVAACFTLAGLIALRRARPILAGGALAAAALTRETALVIVAAVALVRLSQMVRSKARPGRDDLAWVIPSVVFGAWQLTVKAVTGSLPARSDAGSNLSFPLTAMVGGIHHFLTLMPSKTATIWFGELIVLAVVASLAGWSLRGSSVPAHEKLSWALMLLLLVSLSSAVWSNSADFRAFDELFLLSWLVLLGARRWNYVPALMTAGAWMVVAIYHVAVL